MGQYRMSDGLRLLMFTNLGNKYIDVNKIRRYLNCTFSKQIPVECYILFTLISTCIVNSTNLKKNFS